MSLPTRPSEPDVQPTSLLGRVLRRLLVLIRSSAVGLAATASDLATLSLLVYVFGMDDQIANIPSLIPGLVVMFVGNKYFAFEDRSRAVLRQGTVFLIIELIAFGLNALLYFLIRTWFDLHPILSRLLGTNLTYLGFSFPLWSLLVFRHRGEDSPVEASAEGLTRDARVRE